MLTLKRPFLNQPPQPYSIQPSTYAACSMHACLLNLIIDLQLKLNDAKI